MANGNSSPASNTHDADNLNGAMSTPPPPDAMPTETHDTMPETMPDAVPNEPAPSPPPVETRLVELTFNSSAGESVTFKVKNTMKLRKAMDAYSARFQRPVDQLRFLFDGQRLGSEDTPAAHDMESGDIVEVHVEQLGGGSNAASDDSSDDEDWEDWVEIEESEEPKEDLLQKTVNEKARLRAVFDRLKKELIALKASNRSLAKENNDLTVAKNELIADNPEIFEEFTKLMIEYQSVGSLQKMLEKEVRALKTSVSQKDLAIDSILKDFHFTLD